MGASFCAGSPSKKGLFGVLTTAIRLLYKRAESDLWLCPKVRNLGVGIANDQVEDPI
jgi:hypothetical protein